VGSEHQLTIGELARTVAAIAAPQATIRTEQKPLAGVPATRYVPAIQRAKEELGLRSWISLADGVRRTHDWHARVAQGVCG
jgi:dTDP-glucose 4,6-dehydratase